MGEQRVLTIHTDGGARGNPGPGAIGVVIEAGGRRLESFGRYVGDHVTNNQAEYLAVEAALQRAKEIGAHRIRLYLDSELVASQLRREFKIKDQELGKIFLRVWNLMQGFAHVAIMTVPREKNWAADREVNQALDAVR